MSVLTILLSFIVAAVNPQQPSFLDTFRQKVEQECVYVEYEYVATVSGVKTKGDGQIHVQSNAYRMNGNGLEIYCDGESTWVIDEAAGEVMIESATSKDAGYLANPVLLLVNIEKTALSYESMGNNVTVELDGVRLQITVKKMETSDMKKTEDFRPPYEFDADWIVTDLR